MFNRLNDLKLKGYTPDCVVDIGAHHGMWTQNVMQIYPSAQYLMFEATDYDELGRLKSLPNVKVFKEVLNDVVGEVDWWGNREAGDSMFRVRNDSTTPTRRRATTLDSLVRPEDARVLMKIDCQGAEIPIMKGATQWYQSIDFVALKTPFFGRRRESVPSFREHVDFMETIGFVPYDLVDVHPEGGFTTALDVLFINKAHPFNEAVQRQLRSLGRVRSLNEVVRTNRSSLNAIPNFLNEDEYLSSKDNYGLPKHVMHLINTPISDDYTYVDVLMYLSQHLRVDSVCYVEIGVSVLKTFWQCANFLEGSELFAFDWNAMNQIVADKFVALGGEGSCRRFEYKTNRIAYFQGDVYSPSDLAGFKSQFNTMPNVIFSDAHHLGSGMLSEYNHFISHVLKGQPFVLYYDDLHRKEDCMVAAFESIAQSIIRDHREITAAILHVNGWLGQHEHKHPNGIITNLKLKQIMRSANVSIQYLT